MKRPVRKMDMDLYLYSQMQDEYIDFLLENCSKRLRNEHDEKAKIASTVKGVNERRREKELAKANGSKG